MAEDRRSRALARFVHGASALFAALGLASQPSVAATLSLCADTTGTSACPLPAGGNAAGDTVRVLAGSIVNHHFASPGPAYLNQGAIEVQAGGAFTQTGWAFLRTTGTGTLVNEGSIGNDAILQVEDDGRIENRAGAVVTNTVDLTVYDDGVLANAGSIDNYGYVYTLVDVGNDPPGDPDDPTVENSGTLHNHALATIASDGIVRSSGALYNHADATFENTGLFESSGLFVSDGYLGNTVYSAGGGAIVNSGDFRVSATGLVDRSTATRPFGSFTQTAGSVAVDGVVRVATFAVQAGSVSGTGTIRGTVAIGDGAGASAALDPGTAGDETTLLDVVGSLTFASDAELTIEIASLSDFDRLAITGASVLDGALTVVLEGGFAPALGATIPFLSAASVAGGFDQTSFPVFGGRTFALVLDPLGSALLQVVPIPEPATLPLLLAGLALLSRGRRPSPRRSAVRMRIFEVIDRRSGDLLTLER